MVRVLANLEDENEQFVASVEVESDERYEVNGWFRTDDGGIYVIAQVAPGQPPIDVELTAVWIDGPHPTTLVGAESAE
jgi:hypothetical protein